MWHIRKSDGTVYGPVEEHTLEHWAADGRIAPEDELSDDEENWRPVREVPAVNMNWIVPFEDGTHYGPVHILSLRDALKEGSIASDTRVKNIETDSAMALAEAMLVPLAAWSNLLEEEAHALEDQLSSLYAEVETLRQHAGESPPGGEATKTIAPGDDSMGEILAMIKAKDEELETASVIRSEIEQNAEERIQHVEKLLQHEKEATERAQKRLADLEKQHLSLVTSYRELNDRLISSRQKTPPTT